MSDVSQNATPGSAVRIERSAPGSFDPNRIYAGIVQIFHNLPAMPALLAITRSAVETAFVGHDPQQAEHDLDKVPFMNCAVAAQQAFRHHPTVRGLMAQALVEAGVAAAHCFLDKVALRVLPSRSSHTGGRASGTRVHRDTWGSNLAAQINWWAPVYPVRADNALVIYPDYWDRPVANSSADWRFTDLIAAQRIHKSMLAPAYPMSPYATEVVELSAACPVLVQPGELVCFSGAHLHGGQPNRSHVTRFNLETRSVDVRDLHAERGAPIVDFYGDYRHPEWFRHIASGQPLPPNAS